MKKTYIIIGGATIIHGIGDVRIEYKPGAEIELMDEEAARLGISVELKPVPESLSRETKENPDANKETTDKGFARFLKKSKK